MIKSNNKKKILALLTITLAVVIALSCVIGIFGDSANISNYAEDISDNVISTPLARPTTPTTGGFSYFANGVKYVFTDKDKVDGFKAGTEQFDISTVVVNSSDVQGTQTNPHVITSIDEWEVFVKKMATDSTHGTGQYYVLGNDLDFDGVAFHPVVNFNGTFYGLGYSLKNITCATWQYWTGSAYANIGTSSVALGGFGAFCRLNDGTITDLIVTDYSYQNVPQNQTYYSNHGPYVGGIVGSSYGNNNILNCHTTGEIKSTVSYSTYAISGGIVGMHNIANKTLLTYRCSSELDVSVKCGSAPVTGGMVGYPVSGLTVVYDCVANVRNPHTSASDYIGASVSLARGNVTIENFVGTTTITPSSSSAGSNCGLVGVDTNNVTLKIKNTYFEGLKGIASATTKNPIYAVIGRVKAVANNVININVVKTSAKYSTLSSGTSDALSNISSEPNEFSNSDLMLASAKTFFSGSQYSNIWDTSKIGGSYDPDNSPVRNYLVATITFKNLLSGDKEENIVSVPTNDYMTGDELPNASNNANFASYIASKTNHIFKGWTNDPTGNSEPFTELPAGFFGEITLYAVWGLSDSYVTSNIKTSLSVDKNTIEYDSVESITLTAKVMHTAPSSGAMTNPSVTYYIMQDGEDKTTTANVKNSGVLSVKTVADSGKYTFKYRLTDGLEPLWYYDGTPTDSVDIEIEKGKLEHMTLKDFKISSSTVPYFGKKLEDI
ncbi:MAG: hypothetical protein K2L52_01300, partial [Clostridia bacterium]|nr:hypothetical protein [Clostridia bacterium]